MVFLQKCYCEAEVISEDLNYILGISPDTCAASLTPPQITELYGTLGISYSTPLKQLREAHKVTQLLSGKARDGTQTPGP